MLDSYLGVALQLASTVIVSRLLTPSEVGVFAIAAVFSSLASTFRDFGVAEYMIQERELNDRRIRAALAMNIIVSWLMAALLAVIGPLAGSFYEDAGVRNVMWVLALNFVFVPFGAVTMAWFRRELNYKPIVIANALSSVMAFIVAVGLAHAGWGYMSLAWSSLAGIIVSVLAAAWFRPAGFPSSPSLAGLSEVFNFGKFATGIYIFARLGKGAPELIIGKSGGPADVGIFSRANGLVEIFNRLVLRSVMQVCLPYFARSDRESGALTPAYLRSTTLVTAVGWPFLAVMAVLAFPAVRLIYGAQWLEAVALAQILCLAMAIELIHAMSREALLARGDARRANALQMQIVAMQVLGLTAAIPYGLQGACWGLVAAAGAGAALSQWHLKRAIGLKLGGMMAACRSSLWLSVATAVPLAVVSVWLPPDESNFVIWATAASIVASSVWVAGLFAQKHPLWIDLTEVAERLIRRWRGSGPTSGSM